MPRLGELLQEHFVSLREAHNSFFTLETFRRVTECDECDDAARHQCEGAEPENVEENALHGTILPEFTSLAYSCSYAKPVSGYQWGHAPTAAGSVHDEPAE